MAHNATGKTKVSTGNTKPSRIGATSVSNINHHKGKNAKAVSGKNTAEGKFADFQFPGKLA